VTGAITVGSFGWRQGVRYGGLGLPLAFAALPIYVLLPHHYAATLGVPLAALGAVLMATRLLDAFVDPWIGAWVDRWFAHSRARVMQALGLSVAALGAGFAALFSPPISGTVPLLAWCAAMVIVTTFGYSVAGIVHQAWGARLGGDAAARTRVVSWREGLSLAGVLLASTLPGLVGVFLVNGIASAVPATLVLFFIRDRLQAPAFEPLFLASYFAAGALAMPLWVRVVARFGPGARLAGRHGAGGGRLRLGRAAWARATWRLHRRLRGQRRGAGRRPGLPGALLAGVMQRAGHGQQLEGAYFGWWNFATKLNLALAAGLALPLLQLAGLHARAPRRRQALQALTLAYCLLPCLLKLLAAALLWRLDP
jgi:GPH family glycoside/pentoside/hexuronide:cation symporter